MRNLCFRTLTLALGILAIVGGSGRLHGQQYVELIKFTNTWRYNQAGLNLGSTWIAPTYDDIGNPGWQGGPALLGLESPLGGNYNEATLVSGTIPTPLSLFSGGGTNGTNITFYFRTKFNNTLSSLTGVELWATNFVDDGCVIYLNGFRVADVRLTNASPNYLTLANGGPNVEGQYDVESIPINRLIATPNSVNTMAVEVHQGTINSSDVTFAMKLVAIVPTPLTIATQPQNIAATVGDNVAFTIGVTGGPVSYRWYRSGFPAVISTSNSLPFVNVQLTNSGISYYCVITNALTPPRTSSVATLTVVLDTFGPEVATAVPVESGVTNLIRIDFDEQLLNSPEARNTNNYRVLISGTTNQFIGVSNVQISGRSAIVRVFTNNWVLGSNYYVLMNNVQDAKGNFIAPNTVVPVSWNYTVPMTQIGDLWNYYDCGDPACGGDPSAVYGNQAWSRTNYVLSAEWGIGAGIFARESGIPSLLCAGDSINTTLSFQTLPTLFRRTFQLAPSYGTSGTLRLRFIVDDGMVLFLNGREIYRWNVFPTNSPTPGPEVTINSRAIANIPGAVCVTNVSLPVTNLLPGTNWLAAAILQHATDDGDTVFGLEMDGTFLRSSPIPSLAPTNLLRITETKLPNNMSRISWPVSITPTSGFYGFHLLWGSNGTQGLRFPNHNQVTNQSNPYTNSASPRLFRVGKEKP